MIPSSCADLAASLGTDSRVTDHQGGLRPLPKKTGVSNSEAHAAPRQHKTAAAKIWARMLLRYTGHLQQAPQPLWCGEAQASLCTADPSFSCVHSVSANPMCKPEESACRNRIQVCHARTLAIAQPGRAPGSGLFPQRHRKQRKMCSTSLAQAGTLSAPPIGRLDVAGWTRTRPSTFLYDRVRKGRRRPSKAPARP